MNQRTLARETTLSGVSLFRAEPSTCTIAPSPADSGIVFVVDNQEIPATAPHITCASVHDAFRNFPPRCTGLEHNGAHVWTVEHILAALAGAQIFNARITLDAHEIPILDGSALEFTNAIHNAGIQDLDAPQHLVTPKDAVRVEHNDAFIEITPITDQHESPSMSYEIGYPEPSPIASAKVRWDHDAKDFTDRIAPARTFSLEHEAKTMQSLGLFDHLSTSDMLVLNDDGPINNTLRHKHECALHKLLDLIGDLSLAGAPIHAHVRAHKSGHALAHRAAQTLLASQ